MFTVNWTNAVIMVATAPMIAAMTPSDIGICSTSLPFLRMQNIRDDAARRRPRGAAHALPGEE
jgi:hypothetical protein